MKSLSIVIVEDEIIIANLIKEYMVERGHIVLGIAISYEEAVSLYLEFNPDLFILDIRLYGDKSGIDFSRFIQQQPNSPPFVFLTSQFDTRILEVALMSNPNGYLTKPITKESLWTTVESAMKLHSNKFQKTTKTEAQKIVKIYDGRIYHLVPKEEILYIQAEHVYLNVHTIYNKVITTRSTLSDILKLIDSDYLLTCHRSYIVNLRYVTTWSINKLILNNSISIPLSKSRREEVLSKIG